MERYRIRRLRATLLALQAAAELLELFPDGVWLVELAGVKGTPSPTQPSLGTLIRIGNDFLFSGEWWITVFPGIALVVLVLSVNLLGDWLRDALNPKLR